jgi:Domain of unknown function (DUF4337)
MELDPLETANSVSEETNAPVKVSTLTTWVAITVALVATFLGVCKVKDDNIVQAMQQAQADKLDNWAFYQARNIREEIARSTALELRLAATGSSPAQQKSYQDAIARYDALAEDQTKKKEEVRAMAEADQKTYDTLNYRDDQFDLADALVAIAISLLAMTALTHKRWLYFVALVPTALGILFGLAGLMGLRIHSDIIAKLLS